MEKGDDITVDEFKKRTKKWLDIDNIPKQVAISTMTITCKMDIEFITANIQKYLELEFGKILAIKCKSLVRTLVHKKQKVSKKSGNFKQRENFYNQVSLKIKIEDKPNPLNVKLFSNGSIQMTGCKSSDNICDSLIMIVERLKEIKAMIDPKKNKVIEKPYVNDISKLRLDNIRDFNIAMANCNFNIKFKINKENCIKIFKAEKYDYTYNPNSNAGLIIKYQYDEDKKISILLFDSGSINIAGANSGDHINKAYKFIVDFLIKNYDKIVENN